MKVCQVDAFFFLLLHGSDEINGQKVIGHSSLLSIANLLDKKHFSNFGRPKKPLYRAALMKQLQMSPFISISANFLCAIEETFQWP